MSRGTIVVVDDERTLARAIRAFLGEAGYEAEAAHDAAGAMALVESLRPDVVFTDVRMPGESGLDLLRRVREFDSSIAVVVMTAFGTIEGAVEAVKLGAFDYLKKPIDLEELRLVADRAREASLLHQELRYYRERHARPATLGGHVLGSSPAFRAVLERARQVAALDETPPVLITGETGTGKGLIARTIHGASARAAAPFIDVNCTALPASLMEAELFGYEKGAFTDAKSSKLGLFEAAEGGFLFLDEIGDVEPGLQGKLLRAIEDRVVRRVGGLRDRHVDVRILAATNRDLEAEVRADRFRRDLYFRLAVILLHLPPLRERGDDVLELAEHYLRAFAGKYARPVRRLAPAAQALLRAYPWPGNVRELSHVIERAVLWSPGPTLEPEHLGLLLPDAAEPPEPAAGAAPDAPPALLPTGAGDLGSWEKAMIERALREAGGNQTRAAQRLGISRDTLRYRIRKWGIEG